MPNRISIEQRPAVVDQKLRQCDWELDTIIGANHHCAMVSALERKSQFICLKLVTHKTAELVTAAIIDKLAGLKHKVHTLTVDNGKEFALHHQLATALEASVYFAHPYRS
ncbi:MAG: IS30 family transposase [candidate division KSB1 bacterium]|nr:IS30 family transposase [candidate division KSB1 bacterium]MDZ7399192.1 IS30 family transposase [candidate division KSB1 bacterium]